jgi:hypothetical protein
VKGTKIVPLNIGELSVVTLGPDGCASRSFALLRKPNDEPYVTTFRTCAPQTIVDDVGARRPLLATQDVEL